MIEVVTISAEKAGSMDRQKQSLEKAKQQLQRILNSAKRVLDVAHIESHSDIQFIATIEKTDVLEGKKT